VVTSGPPHSREKVGRKKRSSVAGRDVTKKRIGSGGIGSRSSVRKILKAKRFFGDDQLQREGRLREGEKPKTMRGWNPKMGSVLKGKGFAGLISGETYPGEKVSRKEFGS